MTERKRACREHNVRDYCLQILMRVLTLLLEVLGEKVRDVNL